MDFRRDTVEGLAERVRSGALGARELLDATLERIEALNPQVNAFVAVDADGARAAADAIDDAVAAGEDPGPLAGIPLAVKDLEDAAGMVTTLGSTLWASDPPARRDSTLVERLRAAGCVVVGKTNTPELGWKAESDNAVYGATRNPWNLERSPGGSSGGSAAALAAGLVPLATGSDGGGSIRIPAALCGMSGMKPSLGRVPAAGPIPPSWPLLSSSGPMALRTSDIALALDTVIGPEPGDIRSLPMPEPSWHRSIEDLHHPRRVGWSPTLGYAQVDREVLSVCERAVHRLADHGVEVVEAGEVFDEDPVATWLTLAATYNLRTLEVYRGSEAWDQIDPGLRASVEWAAASVSAADFIRAEDACHRLNQRLMRTLGEVSILLTPTVAGQTPLSGQPGTIDGQPDVNWVRFTYPFNLTRSPAGSVCAGYTGDGMPVGLQVVGPQHGDVVVLRTMAVLEADLGCDRVAPFG